MYRGLWLSFFKGSYGGLYDWARSKSLVEEQLRAHKCSPGQNTRLGCKGREGKPGLLYRFLWRFRVEGSGLGRGLEKFAWLTSVSGSGLGSFL